MATPAMPEYVEYGSRVSAPPPVECRKGSFLALVVRGEMEKIAALVGKVLTAPASGTVEYRPLFDRMLLLVGSFAEIVSGAKGFTGWGSVAETHLSLWVPVAAGHGGNFLPPRVALAVPYIFVDNPLSYAGGREDYGYPKAMGQFTPADGAGPKVELRVFGGNFGRKNRAGWTHLLTVESGGGVIADASAGWREEAELVPYLEGMETPEARIEGSGLSVSKIIGEILSGAVGQVALKQVRAAGAEDRACYQAVIEAPVKIENLRWRAAAGPWQLAITKLASHPIEVDLGLGGQPAAEFALDVDFDLILEPGTPIAP